MQVVRRGWTLVESVTAIVLLTLVGGTIAGAFSSGQRSVREAAESRVLRAELRDAASLIGGEVRGISALDTMRFVSDTAFEFFTPVLHALACAEGENRLTLTPIVLPAPAPVISPDTGDVLWIWREDSGSAPGRWHRARIAAYSVTSSEPCAAAFDHPGVTAHSVDLVSGPGTIAAGSPVIAARRVRYSIYRGSDGGWYLGYRRCDALGPTRCQAVQPVSGPYRARVGGRSGLTFRFFDSTGEPLTGLGTPSRVDVIAHPDTSSRLRRSLSHSARADSSASTVAIRNAR